MNKLQKRISQCDARLIKIIRGRGVENKLYFKWLAQRIKAWKKLDKMKKSR